MTAFSVSKRKKWCWLPCLHLYLLVASTMDEKFYQFKDFLYSLYTVGFGKPFQSKVWLKVNDPTQASTDPFQKIPFPCLSLPESQVCNQRYHPLTLKGRNEVIFWTMSVQKQLKVTNQALKVTAYYILGKAFAILMCPFKLIRRYITY